MSKETIDRHWNEILEVVNKIEGRGELLLMVGDFNRHLATDPEKDTKTTYGGELINELLNTDKYILVNKTNKVSGGL